VVKFERREVPAVATLLAFPTELTHKTKLSSSTAGLLCLIVLMLGIGKLVLARSTAEAALTA